MSARENRGIAQAQRLAAQLRERADLLERGIALVQSDQEPNLVLALCRESIGRRALAEMESTGQDAEQLSARLIECFGDAGAAVRYLVNGTPPIFGGRTPLQVIENGDSKLLLQSLTALQHGLVA
jgi:hypothetical protein